MFDLKAKLLAKGLVTKEQVDQVNATNKKTKNKPRDVDFLDKDRAKALNTLKAQPKGEQYLTIRKWVDNNRLDKASLADLDDEKFFFEVDGQLTWLTLKKAVIEELKTGQAGIIAYMSNHGLTHAVVKRDIAEDVGAVFPGWVRVLNEKI
jgi:hypothetical protein